jgi:hypothetical protein
VIRAGSVSLVAKDHWNAANVKFTNSNNTMYVQEGKSKCLLENMIKRTTVFFPIDWVAGKQMPPFLSCQMISVLDLN